MVVDGVCGDSVEPVAELRFICTFEAGNALSRFQEHIRGDVLCCMSVKEPVDAVSEYRIVVFAI
jgi:hypothetical protein